jgi:hypothetical protein
MSERKFSSVQYLSVTCIAIHRGNEAEWGGGGTRGP